SSPGEPCAAQRAPGEWDRPQSRKKPWRKRRQVVPRPASATYHGLPGLRHPSERGWDPEYRSDSDFQIERRALLLHVIEVILETDGLVRRRARTAQVRLGPAEDAGLHCEPVGIDRDDLAEPVRKLSP